MLTSTPKSTYWLSTLLGSLFALFIVTGCPMESQSENVNLPRFAELSAFDPHRKAFECKQEVHVNPAISDRAQELFEQAQAMDDWRKVGIEADYAGMARLYGEAMKLGHWRAQYNLATMYLDGLGVQKNGNEALLLTEDLMKRGIPAAWDLMGTLYMNGAGPLKANPTVAYAFWQRAADMGSMRAQSYLGEKLHAGHDEPPVFWGNWEIGEKMLECAYSQGSGQAAFDLGASMNIQARAVGDAVKAAALYQRALQILHDGVKYGHEECANYLFASFDDGDSLVGHAKDPSRARRYKAIANRLWQDKYVKLPNLDRVLPLPPTKLPKWDSNPDTLIDAAKAVRVAPKQQHSAASRYPSSHRAHIPPGNTLEILSHLARMPVLPGFTSVLADRTTSTGLARAQAAGYWQAKLVPETPNERPYVTGLRHELANLSPMRFEEGERMQLTMGNSNLPHEDMTHYLVEWHFAGRPVPAPLRQDWLAKTGTVRAIEAATDVVCKVDKACPSTGIWQPYVLDAMHPLHNTLGTAQFNDGWKWQAFVSEGQPMPSLQRIGTPVEDAQVEWHLMQATELGFAV